MATEPTQLDSNFISLEDARWRLATIWFLGAGLIFLILVGQSLGGVFERDVNKVFGWAIPNIAPTLGLMITVFNTAAIDSNAPEDRIMARKKYYRLSQGLSIFYLGNILLAIVAAPLVSSSSSPIAQHPIEVLYVSSFWLGFMQGLTAAALAALFFTTSRAQRGRQNAAAPSIREAARAPRGMENRR